MAQVLDGSVLYRVRGFGVRVIYTYGFRIQELDAYAARFAKHCTHVLYSDCSSMDGLNGGRMKQMADEFLRGSATAIDPKFRMPPLTQRWLEMSAALPISNCYIPPHLHRETFQSEIAKLTVLTAPATISGENTTSTRNSGSKGIGGSRR
jgi:hypothetical protein